jgi:hypothetical protein
MKKEPTKDAKVMIRINSEILDKLRSQDINIAEVCRQALYKLIKK